MKKLLALALLLCLSAPPSAADCPRIVSQAPYITQTLHWLGLQDCIVGAGRYDTLELPNTGGILDPDADAIAALQPQLLFNTDWLDAGEWQLLAPNGATAITLHGFESMTQIEDNLRTIGRTAGRADAERRADDFAATWRAQAAQVDGGGRRVLLLSACSGTPYSFGKNTWLHDLFTTAGFTVAETETKLRHLHAESPISDIGALADAVQAELLFVFERQGAPQCQLIRPQRPLPIVLLDGEHFLHPAPGAVLDGPAELHDKRTQWRP